MLISLFQRSKHTMFFSAFEEWIWKLPASTGRRAPTWAPWIRGGSWSETRSWSGPMGPMVAIALAHFKHIEIGNIWRHMETHTLWIHLDESWQSWHGLLSLLEGWRMSTGCHGRRLRIPPCRRQETPGPNWALELEPQSLQHPATVEGSTWNLEKELTCHQRLITVFSFELPFILIVSKGKQLAPEARKQRDLVSQVLGGTPKAANLGPLGRWSWTTGNTMGFYHRKEG